MDTKRFCYLLLQKKYLSQTQLNEALGVLRNFQSSGIQKPLFDILIEKEMLSPDQLASLGFQLGPYRLISFLGKGNTARVYKAQHVETGRSVALKIMLDRRGPDEKHLERFRREVQTVLTLDHPNLIKGYEYGEDKGSRYFSMELMEGKSLKDILKEKGTLPEEEALYYMAELIKALNYIEGMNLVHRDIKPDNVMVIPPDIVKLCDLGLAKWVGGEESYKTLTSAGAIVGTPYYVSPELIKGQKDIDIRSDIYSLGATFYHLILGEPPFNGPSAPVVFNLHLIKQVLPYRDLKDQVSRPVYYLLRKMLEKEPGQRYQNSQELLEDLELVQTGEMPGGRKKVSDAYLPATEKKGLPVRLFIILGVVFLFVNLLLSYFVFFSGKGPTKKQKASGSEITKQDPPLRKPSNPDGKEEQMPGTLDKIRQRLIAPNPPYWQLYLQLIAWLEREKTSPWSGRALEWRQELEARREVRDSLDFQRQLLQIQQDLQRQFPRSWQKYQQLLSIMEKYPASPFIAESSRLKESLERRPEIQANLILAKKIEEVERKLKEPKPSFTTLYNEMVMVLRRGKYRGQNNPLVLRAQSLKDLLGTKDEVKAGICRAYLKNLPNLSSADKKRLQKYMTREKNAAALAISNFLLRNQGSPGLKNYFNFFQKFPLPPIYMSEVQQVLAPRLKAEQGVMRYPWVVRLQNKRYGMYYLCGRTTFHGVKIGFAESWDGIKWTGQRILFEVPSWMPSQQGNHWKAFLSFGSLVVDSNRADGLYHMFIQVNSGGALARYILRYTSPDGLHWKTEKKPYYMITNMATPYNSPCLVALPQGAFYLWTAKTYMTLQRFHFKGGRMIGQASSFQNKGFDMTFTVFLWLGKAFCIYYWNEEKKKMEYRLSPNGLQWWGRGTMEFDRKYSLGIPIPPVPRTFIPDPLSRGKSLRAYFYYNERIYTALLGTQKIK